MVNAINPSVNQVLLHSLEKNQKEETKLYQQLASGKRVSTGSDDPTALTKINRLEASLRAIDQASKNIDNTSGLLETAGGG